MITIRAAGPGDVDEVMGLVAAAIETMSNAGIDQWDEIYPDRATILADINQAEMSVATEADGRIVGIVVLNEFQNVEYADVAWTIPALRIAVVHRVVVHPSAQRRGLAGRLMQCAERNAQRLGYDVVRLDAFEDNPTALRLYHRLGYHDAGRVRLRKGVFHCFEKRMVKSRQ